MRGDVGIGMGRAYIIGSNVYFMFGIIVKNEKGTEEVSRFFDSFRLTKNPDPAPATGAVSAGSAEWREISEPGHGFKVSLPGEPKKESSNSFGVMTYSLTSAGDGIACMVMRQWSSVEPDFKSQKDDFYKSYASNFAASAGLEISGETNISVDGRQWREYALKKGELTGAVRVLLDGRNIYAIFALRFFQGVDQKTVSRFFDSFKLIEKSPKDDSPSRRQRPRRR
jgi:hypothetical protein